MKKVKYFNRKIKNVLFALVLCLIAFIGFSKAGILFSASGKNIITVSTPKKAFDPNNYVASMNAVMEKKQQTNTTIDEASIKSSATTSVAKEMVTSSDAIAFEGKSIAEVGEVLNKTLGGVLSGWGETIARLSMEKGMDPYLLSAISVHETGNGTSSAARNKYNFGGIMCSSGLCRYSSVEDGIVSFVNVVYNNYYSKGLTTAESMNKKYAASSSWATKVNSWYNTIKNK